MVLVVLIIAFLQILIGELLPKAVAFRYAEPIARHVSRPVARLIQIGAPLISLLNACNEALLRFFVGKPKHEAAMTEEEISVVLTQGAKAGVFKESQQD